MVLRGIHLTKPRTKQSRNRLYNTARWKNYSKTFLTMNPLCVMCDKEGKVVEAKVVDHIVPITQGGSVWGTFNHQPLCHKHHKSKTGQEGAEKYEELHPKWSKRGA